MSSLSKLWLGLLVAILYAPLRSTSVQFLNIAAINSTDAIVHWKHEGNQPYNWKLQATFEHQPPSEMPVPNSTVLFGSSFYLPLPSQPPINVILEAIGMGPAALHFNNAGPIQNSMKNFKVNPPPSPTPDTTIILGGSSTSTSGILSIGPTSSSLPTQSSVADSSKSHTDVIIGAVVGSVAFLLIAGITLLLCLRNRRRRLERTDPPEFTRDKMVREPYTGFALPSQSTTRDSLSTRSSLYSDDSGRPLKSEPVDASAI